MVLRFTGQAFNDLNDLDQYLADKSPQGLQNVLKSLRTSFDTILGNPFAGYATRTENIRVMVEPVYKYILPYYVDGSSIWILRVYHPRRAPLDYSALALPLEQE